MRATFYEHSELFSRRPGVKTRHPSSSRKSPSSKMNMIAIISACLLTASIRVTRGFQPSMLTPTSRGSFERRRVDHSLGVASIDGKNPRMTTNSDQKPIIPFAIDKKSDFVTSKLISQLACAALKRRLPESAQVACDVAAEPSMLFSGQVGPVTVKGRGWASPLGLTCRAIEATVNECRLDMKRVISHRKLSLTTPGTYGTLAIMNIYFVCRLENFLGKYFALKTTKTNMNLPFLMCACANH